MTARTGWRIGGSLATVVVLVWGLVQTIGVLGHSTESVDVTASADGVEELLVQVGGGSIEIRGTDRDEVVVAGSVTSGLTATAHSEQVDGPRFVVTSRCTSGALATFCEVDHVIEVPRDLTVVVRSSDTAVTLVDLEGRIDVETSESEVHGERLSGERLRIETSNARVDLRSVTSPVASVRSSNDDVAISFDEPIDDVDVDTDNASIEIVLPDTPDPYAVDLDTSNGAEAISVRTDPTGARRIVARSSNGDITVRYAP